MALPDFTMRQLLEAGVHFGHQTHRWNPKMGTYIFGARNNIHIIDLAQTVPLLHQALVAVRDVVAAGGAYPVCRNKTASIGSGVGRCPTMRAILHEPSLAWRNAHQLEDDLQFNKTIAVA